MQPLRPYALPQLSSVQRSHWSDASASTAKKQTMEVDPPPAPAPEATPAALPGDSFYAVDETAVDAQRQAKPWTQDAHLL